MKIIIDDKIPYIKGAFEPVAEVIYLAGSKTTAEVVKDADAIVTRTRTICNEKLLAGSFHAQQRPLQSHHPMVKDPLCLLLTGYGRS
jgi:hypothetical protein